MTLCSTEQLNILIVFTLKYKKTEEQDNYALAVSHIQFQGNYSFKDIKDERLCLGKILIRKNKIKTQVNLVNTSIQLGAELERANTLWN